MQLPARCTSLPLLWSAHQSRASRYALLPSISLLLDQLILQCQQCNASQPSAEHYGFVLDTNPYETAHIPRAVIEEAAGQDCGLAEADCFVHANGVPSWALMKALRLCSLPHKERKTLGHRAAAGQPCSPDTERKVWTFRNYNYQECTELWSS